MITGCRKWKVVVIVCVYTLTDVQCPGMQVNSCIIVLRV